MSEEIKQLAERLDRMEQKLDLLLASRYTTPTVVPTDPYRCAVCGIDSGRSGYVCSYMRCPVRVSC